MPQQVAIVAAGRLAEATAAVLARRLATAHFRVVFEGRQATASMLAAALGDGGAALLLLPAGESAVLGRDLVARGVLVIDLGEDQRLLPHVACALSAEAAGRRMVSFPSPGALASWLPVRPLIEAGLVLADRLAVVLVAGADLDPTQGGSATASAPSSAALAAGASAERIADELSWLSGHPLRATCELVRVPASRALLAVVHADAARDLEPGELRAALSAAARSGWLCAGAARVCDEAESPDPARVAGTGAVELAVREHGLAERVTALCALDPVEFIAAAAVAALQREPRLKP